jgi:uncharacterized protein YtpQ (UPF0354 family)
MVVSLAACQRRSTGAPDLAERVRTRLVAKAPDAHVTIADPTTLQMERGGVKQTMSLDNLSVICATHPEECDNAIERAVASAVTTPAEPAKDGANVRAILKPRTWVAEVTKKMAEIPGEERAKNALFSTPFGPDLFEVLVVDMPNGMAMLTRAQADALGLDAPALVKLAHANMKAQLAPLATEKAASGVLSVRVGDDYEAARLLVPEVWEGIAKQVDGDLLVVAPNRNIVFATGSRDPTPLATMKRLAQDAFAREAYPVSTTVFRRTPTGFVPASP